MKEHRTIGPNHKSFFYFTNSKADEKVVKGIIVIATGAEGTGELYDEVGEYLGNKGYAVYAIDEWGYGKTGKLVAANYKNWKRHDPFYAAYNIHALAVEAKRMHTENTPVYVIGNDFGGFLSLIAVKEFPEAIDKIVTIGLGMPTAHDRVQFVKAWLKKVFLYDQAYTKRSHNSKNRRRKFRYLGDGKNAWMSSDKEVLAKLDEKKYINDAGTIGHYYYYYKTKIRTPRYMILRKTDKTEPYLFVSGDDDQTTNNGSKTKNLATYYKHRKFTNVDSMIVPGRHQVLFDTERFKTIDRIVEWLEGKEQIVVSQIESSKEDTIKQIPQKKEEPVKEEKVEKIPPVFKEAEDEDLLIRSHKE